MIAIQQSKDFDVEDVLRRSPVAETSNAKEIMNECLGRSTQVYYGSVDGSVACVWGIIQPTLLSHSVYLWLLTTDIIVEHKFLFIRYSQIYVEELLEVYDEVIGDVMPDNEPAKRWLKWLGAEIMPPVGGRMPFVIRKKCLYA